MRKFYSAPYQRKIMRQIAQQTMNRNVETKQATYSTTDGLEILHNNFVSLTPNILATGQGVQDPNDTNQACRIGDQISVTGASLRFMFELNERYSDVTLRVMVIRSAKGDVPTRATLFIGRSGNKMLDMIDRERYSVLHQKYVKMKAPNMSVANIGGPNSEIGSTIPPSNAGIQYAATMQNTISRATKIVKIWVPGKKFARNGKIQYENGIAQTKFFDYHVLVYAYSNLTTGQDVWNVARINDYVQMLYFKDA